MLFCTLWIVENMSSLSFDSVHFAELWVSVGVHPVYPVVGSPLFCKAPSHKQNFDTNYSPEGIYFNCT